MKSKLPSEPLVLSFFLLMLIISACKPFNSEQEDWKDVSIVGLPEISEGYLTQSNAPISPIIADKNHYDVRMPEVVQSVQIPSKADETKEAFLESLEISQARFAARRHDKCPKLITTEVDLDRIVRTKEVLKKNYCDYFIFASKGDRITVDVQPDDFEAVLISPVTHHFSNSSFEVEQNDKYVVRVSYEGSEYRNGPLTYDIVIELN